MVPEVTSLSKKELEVVQCFAAEKLSPTVVISTEEYLYLRRCQQLIESFAKTEPCDCGCELNKPVLHRPIDYHLAAKDIMQTFGKKV